MSQGIPFIHAGQEFYRTKGGVYNSYNSPDNINCINWDFRDIYKKDVDDIKKLLSYVKKINVFVMLQMKKLKKCCCRKY